MEHVYVRTNSFRETGRVTTLIITWALALEELGTDEIGSETFVEWALPMQSRATTHRQMKAFRAAFPDHQTPNALAVEVNRLAAQRRVKPDPLVELPATALA
jgi:hypothetical protein